MYSAGEIRECIAQGKSERWSGFLGPVYVKVERPERSSFLSLCEVRGSVFLSI